ncbi:MAG: MetQ/NlpA family ABC transporter substrate-binding protein [Anaerolineaceae bacterium]|nr:MetQ/NlpA family ABC transporter substrate-binding protein [Anaerolineaceae bacterium]
MMSRSWWMRMVLLLALCFAAPLLAQEEAKEPDLRIGVLPVLNTLPLYVAQEAGFFAEEGVSVELVPFQSGLDRQTALLAGVTDASNDDLIGVLLLNAGDVSVRVVRHDPPAEVFFALIAGPESDLESAADLAGASIGISHNTLIQYLTDTMLSSEGLSAEDVEYVEIAEIPVRYQLLLQGQIDAATLPEPLIQAALGSGGRVLIDDSALGYVPTVLSFRADSLAEKGEAVRAFLAAYERAVTALNAGGEAYREVMGANIQMPPPLIPILPVPTFFPASVPSEEDFQAVQDWALAIGLLEEALAYEDVVDGSFLPEVMDDDVDDMSEEDEE